MPLWPATAHSSLPKGLRWQVFAVLLAVRRHRGPCYFRLHEGKATWEWSPRLSILVVDFGLLKTHTHCNTRAHTQIFLQCMPVQG